MARWHFAVYDSDVFRRHSSRDATRFRNYVHLEQQAAPVSYILIHGFPDIAEGWGHVADRLQQFGNVYALRLPGYETASKMPVPDFRELVDDLIRTLDTIQGPLVLVGHDWGAFLVYLCAARKADSAKDSVLRRTKFVAVSVPPLRSFIGSLFGPQFGRSSYMLRFQRSAATQKVQKGYWRDLWKRWSPSLKIEGSDTERHLEEHFGVRMRADNALNYYRALFAPKNAWIFKEAVGQKISARVTMVTGADDGCIAPQVFESASKAFFIQAEPVQVIQNAGHFVQYEQPEQLAHIIRDAV